MRVEGDRYYTHKALTEQLLKLYQFKGRVLEPCCGEGAIASFFPDCITNDIDLTVSADYHLDIAEWSTWEAFTGLDVDWVITNPPYDKRSLSFIVQNSYAIAHRGIAMLLRLSYLEPARDRAEWLRQHNENLALIAPISPRPRFRTDTNGSDSVTVCWFVWDKGKRTSTRYVPITNWKPERENDLSKAS